MNIRPFELERYFAKHEFAARYLLSSSDCEALSLADLLAMADPDTLQIWQELKLGYTESQGHPLLRELISGSYSGYEPADILVLAPEEGIFLFMHALLQPGDHVICTFPAYQSLYEVARSIGCEVQTWEPDEAQGWRFDIRQLEGMIRSNTKLMIVNFPHNPTGYVPPQADFEQLVDFVRQREIHLLSDEMYRYLELEPDSTLPSACELYDHAVSLSGLSKSYGLPGLRIGWIATKDSKLIHRIGMLKDYTTICSSAPSEILAMIALRSKETIIRQQSDRVRRNIGILDEFFQGYQDIFRWNRPVGGSICFPRMLMVQDTYEFCKQLVEETGIMLVPSKMFDFGDHHVRIGFGREDMPEVLSKFAEYLERNFR